MFLIHWWYIDLVMLISFEPWIVLILAHWDSLDLLWSNHVRFFVFNSLIACHPSYIWFFCWFHLNHDGFLLQLIDITWIVHASYIRWIKCSFCLFTLALHGSWNRVCMHVMGSIMACSLVSFHPCKSLSSTGVIWITNGSSFGSWLLTESILLI